MSRREWPRASCPCASWRRRCTCDRLQCLPCSSSRGMTSCTLLGHVGEVARRTSAGLPPSSSVIASPVLTTLLGRERRPKNPSSFSKFAAVLRGSDSILNTFTLGIFPHRSLTVVTECTERETHCDSPPQTTQMLKRESRGITRPTLAVYAEKLARGRGRSATTSTRVVLMQKEPTPHDA